MMKIVLVLGMIACLFGLTACGNEEASVMTEEELAAVQVADSYISQVMEVVNQGAEAEYVAYDESLAPIFDSWKSGMEELGSYVETTGHEVKIDGDEVVVNTAITGSALDPNGNPRTADVELIYNSKEYMINSMVVNVNYTMGEKMTNAALNTLLGMGTVFIVLILISLIISCFSLIPKIQALFAKKEKVSETEKSVDNTIAQIVAAEEADDTELIAVISAAIAAYEAANGGTADGVVIRSVRKVNRNKWQNA
ncbi:MAG: OadG family protein [Lachnospiraceae bacterium]|nr:OadG family protein [Lachnospiraceae bacterium]